MQRKIKNVFKEYSFYLFININNRWVEQSYIHKKALFYKAFKNSKITLKSIKITQNLLSNHAKEIAQLLLEFIGKLFKFIIIKY